MGDPAHGLVLTAISATGHEAGRPERGGRAVNLQRVLILVGVAFALFFVISQPQHSADLVLSILNILRNAAESVVQFIRALF